MPVDPTEVEVIREAIRSALIDVHVALPARVDSYNAAKQTVKVTLCVTRDRMITDTREIATEEMPQLDNVPVAWPRGGGFFMTMPIKKGDFVQLVFNESATGVFRESGEVPSRPGDLRRHHIAHPVAIPGGGAFPDSGPIGDASDNDMVFGNDGGPVVTIKANGDIEIGGTTLVGDATKILAELGNVAIAINGIAPGAYTPPVNPADLALDKVKGS